MSPPPLVLGVFVGSSRRFYCVRCRGSRPPRPAAGSHPTRLASDYLYSALVGQVRTIPMSTTVVSPPPPWRSPPLERACLDTWRIDVSVRTRSTGDESPHICSFLKLTFLHVSIIHAPSCHYEARKPLPFTAMRSFRLSVYGILDAEQIPHDASSSLLVLRSRTSGYSSVVY